MARWQPLETPEALLALAGAAPRPLNFVRHRPHWEHWVLETLRQLPTLMCLLPGRGYLLLSIPDNENWKMSAPEWCAVSAAAEQELLQAAAGEASRRGRPLVFATLPQHLPTDFWGTLGTVTVQTDEGPMARNIRLPGETFQDVLQAYRSGAAVWWAGDRG